MSQKLNSAIAVIGIDMGKNSFHVVGHDRRGAIVLRQKWSRGQVETRLANLPPCLIGMEACVTDEVRMQILDPMRMTLKSRIDVYPGQSEHLDIAVRLDDEDECYGWNNETYSGDNPWRNPQWRLARGRYLIKVTVVSSGQTCEEVFSLINDVDRGDFRLERATPAQKRAVRAMERLAGASG
jgi:hypothetical protein